MRQGASNLLTAQGKGGATKRTKRAKGTIKRTTKRAKKCALTRERPDRRNAATAVDDGTQVDREKQKKVKKAGKKESEHSDKRAKMKAFCMAAIQLGVKGIQDEFNEIKATSTPLDQVPRAIFDGNKEKNRYRDVVCRDDSRVVLSSIDGASDYIHANYVDSWDKKHRFICTQAPMPNTVEDFWRMVWQEKTKAIVMLCVVDSDKKKCDQYWPVEKDSEETRGKLTVKNVGISEVEVGVLVTRLTISEGDGSENLQVQHILWSNWPDRGVPEHQFACFRILQRVKDVAHVVVHCSAGIGRTGTIVALDIARHGFDIGETVSLLDLVKKLREQRTGCVQTFVQYLYMYRCLIALSERKKAVETSEIEGFVREYDEMMKTLCA